MNGRSAEVVADERAGRGSFAPQRAGRGARARRRAAPRTCRSCSTSCSGGRTSRRRCCSPPATASRSTPSSRPSTAASPTSPRCWPGTPALTLSELTDHLYVHYAGSAVQHLFSVAAGLDSMVVGEAQILGQLRAAYAAADEAGTVGRVAARAGPAGAAGRQAGARRDRHRRRGRLGGLRGARRRRRAAATVASPGGARCRRRRVDGRAGRRAPAPRRRRRDRRAQPHRGNGPRGSPRSPRPRAPRPAPPASTRWPASSPPPTSWWPAPAPSAPWSTARPWPPRWPGAPSGRWSSATSACPATSTRRVAELAGVTVVDLAALQRRLARRAARRRGRPRPRSWSPRRRRPTSPRSAPPRSPRRSPRCAGAPPRWSTPSCCGWTRGCPTSTTRSATEFAQTVRRVVDKLLHTPTVQVKRLAEGPDGDSYADALRELFELDPQTPAAVAVQRSGDVLAALEARTESDEDAGAAMSPLRIGTRPSALAMAQTGHRRRAAARRRRTVELVDDRARRATARRRRSRELGVGVFVSALRDALAARRDRRRRALLQGPAHRPGPAAVARRGAAAGGPARRAGGPRRDGARRAAARRARRHRLAAARGPARRARPRPARSCRSGATSTPGSRKVRAGELDAVVLAAAGLRRLGRLDEVTELLDPLQMLPAPAQGALAVECRVGDVGRRAPAALAAVLDDGSRGPRSPPSGPCWPRWRRAAARRSARWPTSWTTWTTTGRTCGRPRCRCAAVVGTTDGGAAARLRHRRHGRRREARRGAGRGAARPRGAATCPPARAAGSGVRREMSRAPVQTPGRVAFVGSGPGDPGLLTVRARDALAGAPLVVTDPDVPDGVLALAADGAEVRPAVGEPADVARDLRRRGRSRPRGRPAGRRRPADRRLGRRRGASPSPRAGVPFDVVPGVPAGTAVPGLRRRAARLGAHRGRRPRPASTGPRLAGRAGHAGAARHRRRTCAEVAAALTENGVAAQTPVAVTADGTATTQQTVQTTLATLAADAGELDGPAGRHRRRRGRRCAPSCPGGSRARCTAGGCWCRAPRTRPAR